MTETDDGPAGEFEINFQRLGAYTCKFNLYESDGTTIRKVGTLKASNSDAAREQLKTLAKDVGVVDPDLTSEQWFQAAMQEMNKDKGLPVVPKNPVNDQQETSVRLLQEMPIDAIQEAEKRLNDPELLSRVVEDIRMTGVVGDIVLKMLVYLCGVSRLFENPFNLLVMGATSSGKSFITGKVSALFPCESKMVLTSFSEQAFYYLGENFLVHRFVIAGERTRSVDSDKGDGQKGREVIRQLLSEKEVVRIVTSERGRRAERHVCRGPIAYIETTTNTSIMEEDFNRVLAIDTDDSAEQTAQVLGVITDDFTKQPTPDRAAQLQLIHHAIHRLMVSEVGAGIRVTVPYAHHVQEMFKKAHQPDTRRYYMSFLSVLSAITLLHWRQRKKDDFGRLVASRDDYVAAKKLLNEAISSALLGGVKPKDRKFIEAIMQNCVDENRKAMPFSASTATESTGLPRRTVYRRIKSLIELGVLEKCLIGSGATADKYRIINPEWVTILEDLPTEKVE